MQGYLLDTLLDTLGLMVDGEKLMRVDWWIGPAVVVLVIECDIVENTYAWCTLKC